MKTKDDVIKVLIVNRTFSTYLFKYYLIYGINPRKSISAITGNQERHHLLRFPRLPRSRHSLLRLIRAYLRSYQDTCWARSRLQEQRYQGCCRQRRSHSFGPGRWIYPPRCHQTQGRHEQSWRSLQKQVRQWWEWMCEFHRCWRKAISLHTILVILCKSSPRPFRSTRPQSDHEIKRNFSIYLEKSPFQRICHYLKRIQPRRICQKRKNITPWLAQWVFERTKRKHDTFPRHKTSPNLSFLLHCRWVRRIEAQRNLQRKCYFNLEYSNVLVFDGISLSSPIKARSVHFRNHNRIDEILRVFLWISFLIQQIRPSFCSWIQMGRDVKRRNRHFQWSLCFQRDGFNWENAFFCKHNFARIGSSLVRQLGYNDLVGWSLAEWKLCWLHLSFLPWENQKQLQNYPLWI